MYTKLAVATAATLFAATVVAAAYAASSPIMGPAASISRPAFHGFYDSKGYPHEPCYENADRKPKPSCDKDSPTVAHHRRFSDYSQGVRLVHPQMEIDGVPHLVADVLTDKKLCKLIAEGQIDPPRVPLPATSP